jgi:hypothetical protein
MELSIIKDMLAQELIQITGVRLVNNLLHPAKGWDNPSSLMLEVHEQLSFSVFS